MILTIPNYEQEWGLITVDLKITTEGNGSEM